MNDNIAVVSVLCHHSRLLGAPYLHSQFPVTHVHLQYPQTSQIQYIQKKKNMLITFPPKTCLSSCGPQQLKLKIFCVILSTSLPLLPFYQLLSHNSMFLPSLFHLDDSSLDQLYLATRCLSCCMILHLKNFCIYSFIFIFNFPSKT